MEEKIKVNFKEKPYGSFKIGDNTIKVKQWLNISEVAYIINETCSYYKDLIAQNQSDAVVLVATISKMNMLIVALATNLDLENIEADTLGGAGIFNIIQDKVLNYNMIKDLVIIL